MNQFLGRSLRFCTILSAGAILMMLSGQSGFADELAGATDQVVTPAYTTPAATSYAPREVKPVKGPVDKTKKPESVEKNCGAMRLSSYGPIEYVKRRSGETVMYFSCKGALLTDAEYDLSKRRPGSHIEIRVGQNAPNPLPNVTLLEFRCTEKDGQKFIHGKGPNWVTQILAVGLSSQNMDSVEDCLGGFFERKNK